MKRPKLQLISHVMNIVIIVLIIASFVTAILTVRYFAIEDCFDRIEETATQASDMFIHAMERNYEQLSLFADILATNSSNPDPILLSYMESFCATQSFSSVCVERADGTYIKYGKHPHDEVSSDPGRGENVIISEVISLGEMRSEKFVYQSVPIYRNNEFVGTLYGFISLDIFPSFISCTMYGGKCEFYILDGDTGYFLMDEYRRYAADDTERKNELPLNNLFDGSMSKLETKKGYDIEQACDNIRNGKSGYCIFKSQETGQWIYTYYIPIVMTDAQGSNTPANNWFLVLNIDENTAFEAYNDISITVLDLMFLVIVMMAIHILVLMLQNARVNRMDRENLHRLNYMSSVERALISAHNDPELIDRSLQIITDEIGAEGAALLIFDNSVITDVYRWPSKEGVDYTQLLGRNIRDELSNFYNALTAGESVLYSENDESEKTKKILDYFGINNILSVPIMDTNLGILKGVLCAVDLKNEDSDSQILECVSHDFFMAVTNLENHRIIQSMGTMDYLTKAKNRNSFESESAKFASLDAKTLWCLFVDVNGLHELNNRCGHKAGDNMLCAVASALKVRLGDDKTYRLGGDEFVAFATDATYDEFMDIKSGIIDEMASQGYFVSVGFAWGEKGENDEFDIDDIMSRAEALMYRDKWEYYEKNNIPTGRGPLPHIMENQ